jgi:hypothetical protein
MKRKSRMLPEAFVELFQGNGLNAIAVPLSCPPTALLRTRTPSGLPSFIFVFSFLVSRVQRVDLARR